MTTVELSLRFFDPPVRLPQPLDGDVAYAVHDTPLGQLVLALDNTGTVIACSYDDEAAVSSRLAAAVSPRVLRQPARLDRVRRQLDEYLAGERRELDVPVSPVLATPFGQRVLHALRQVPYGATTHYAELAGAIGAPGASRAVGNALGGNPVCILLPCHRVLRSDGSLGGYAGGVATKQALLKLERTAGS